MTVQSIFDDIVPNILCLGAFGIVFYLLKKEVKPLTILIGLAFFGIFGSWIGIFKKEQRKCLRCKIISMKKRKY